MKNYLEFEKPIFELKEKISELIAYAEDADVDLNKEISNLQKRVDNLQDEIYSNLTPWQRVQIARHPNRPTTLDYIPLLFDNFIELHGDRYFGDDKAIVGGVAKFNRTPVTIIGQQRGRDTKENLFRNFGMPNPEGYRKALRLMKQAEKFNRPIISFIDTKGAFPGKGAEERGQSRALAHNLFEMAGLRVPIICIVIGEGASGGALGIGVGNHLHMLENTWFSVIAPESAAALLWKDSTKGEAAANSMKITAPDLKELGIIDQIITEIKGGAHNNPKEQVVKVKEVIKSSLDEFSSYSEEMVVEHRYNKYKDVGVYSTNHFV
ncbi:acetyl-CoA carboxylase carboxyl transferase subunit alpha [Filobacillus milosensis]|uniref:Acetyl-coenzyme A carboxylase carboxyl transferase subunit alpha n=1 Tax=Filobacillus milosensis TaxID=94137 RepID=A0A4Y8IE78_9BACI|nr:acetyl-CoA carboxylase carboxyl transferase subunit alpha [Filobacillus milosensis]TFB13305.1 acetyl-CoA carboxylase carboxyl transferase subunit alpha [Filobacillus milosensis]